MAKFRGEIGTPYINSQYRFVFEVDDEDLEDLTEEDREKIIEEVFQEHMWEYLDASWSPVAERSDAAEGAPKDAP